MKIFSSTNEDFQQVLLVGSNYMENALCIVQHSQNIARMSELEQAAAGIRELNSRLARAGQG